MTGAIEQPHVRPWSTVLRVPAGDEIVFFKANGPGFAQEARALAVLEPLAPGLLPSLVAVDLERGWMLLDDAGDRLRERPDAVRWNVLLEPYADLQQAAAPETARLVAAGVPDCRLHRLPELYERLGGRDVPMVRALCDALAAFGLPETIDHDDLHDGQVFVRDGQPRIVDWGDSCVSHPFLTLAVTMQFAAADAVDAYLARWDAYGSVAELREAVPLARRLGGVPRALTWARVQQVAPADWDRDEGWLDRVGMPPEEWDAR